MLSEVPHGSDTARDRIEADELARLVEEFRASLPAPGQDQSQ
jgi:hypothetical protein